MSWGCGSVGTLWAVGGARGIPADPSDVADALAFALRFQGRDRQHDAAEMMARIVAKRLVDHL